MNVSLIMMAIAQPPAEYTIDRPMHSVANITIPQRMVMWILHSIDSITSTDIGSYLLPHPPTEFRDENRGSQRN
jgi:hypothetical protein